MEKALVSLASKTEDKAPENKATASPPSSVTPATSSAAPLPAALKGVSQSLLDRVLQLILLSLFNVSLPSHIYLLLLFMSSALCVYLISFLFF